MNSNTAETPQELEIKQEPSDKNEAINTDTKTLMESHLLLERFDETIILDPLYLLTVSSFPCVGISNNISFEQHRCRIS